VASPTTTDAKIPKPVDPRSRRERFASSWAEAKALIWARRNRLALGLGLMLVSRGAGLVLPATSKFLIDEVIGKHRIELLGWLAAAGGIATLVQAATSFALSQILGVAAQRSITEMRKSVQQHVERLPVSYFDSTKSGELLSRIMNDAEGIRNLVGTGLVELVGGLVTAVVAFAVLLWLSWKLTLVNLAALLLFGGGMTLAFKRLRPLFRERGKIQAEVSGRLVESLGGIRIVKAFTAEKHEEVVFAKGAHKLFRNVARTMTGVSGVSALSSVVIGAIGVAMTLVGGHAILDGSMTLGDWVMYVFFTGLLAAPLIQISAIGTQITEALAGIDRIRELKRLATEDAGDVARSTLPSVRGDVRFEGVSFAYVPDVFVLRDVSFHAPAGSTTALVGSSGSGKSTLIGLVMAFHRPASGRVLVDEVDLATVRLRDYRAHLGVVLQDNFLFDGTIAENIAYSRPRASRAEIEAAARIAHCDQFVSGFEKGYDTVIGERGVKLSGGQRQRVAIARAVLADPTILILDEATASLDSESEAMIQDGLKKLRRGRTSFVIAHRLSTIRSADQILVLEKGEIVERGTHAELLALGGRYRELYDRQYHFEEDRFVNPGEDWTPEPVEAARARPPTDARRL
jgi:ATP-binding cassette, subfamily B, putative efflux pump